MTAALERPTVECGDLVQDDITGFKGVVTSVQFWENGNAKATVMPRELKDGKLQEPEVFDFEELEVLEKGVVKVIPFAGKDKFEYGDEVKCIRSGWHGIVRAIRFSRTGCTQYGVYPNKTDKDGEKPGDGWLFMHNEIELVKKANPPVKEKTDGTGPARLGRQSLR